MSWELRIQARVLLKSLMKVKWKKLANESKIEKILRAKHRRSAVRNL
jgi:hypothetical protein